MGFGSKQISVGAPTALRQDTSLAKRVEISWRKSGPKSENENKNEKMKRNPESLTISL
jgi:hypothetical protein